MTHYKMKADGSPEFDAAGLPVLKPCPRCNSRLEYWDLVKGIAFIACSNRDCLFTVELPSKRQPKETP